MRVIGLHIYKSREAKYAQCQQEAELLPIVRSCLEKPCIMPCIITSVMLNLTKRSFMCLLAWSWKTLRKLFSGVLKRSRKRAVQISIRWLTGKKTKYFCDSSTICFEPVHKIFMNTRVTTQLSECLWRDITGHASVPYNMAVIHLDISDVSLFAMFCCMFLSTFYAWKRDIERLQIGVVSW